MWYIVLLMAGLWNISLNAMYEDRTKVSVTSDGFITTANHMDPDLRMSKVRQYHTGMCSYLERIER